MARKGKLQLHDVSNAMDTAPAPTAGARHGGQYQIAMAQQIATAKAELTETKATLAEIHDAVRTGRAAVEIEPDQIRDSVGTDRLSAWADAEEFATLRKNIRERGQTQPIRVRPERSDWMPDPTRPFEIGGNERFIVQSGRRRLEACRQLGIKVLAIITIEEGDVDLADLTERYFENKMREDLTPLEDLLAIASIAKKMESAAADQGVAKPSQREIAEHIGTNQAYVSLGLSCDRYRTELKAQLPENATVRDIRDLLPLLKGPEGQGEPAAVISTEITAEDAPDPARMEVKVREVRPVRVVELGGGGKVRIKPTNNGVSLTVRNVSIEPDREDEFESALKKLLEQFEA